MICCIFGLLCCVLLCCNVLCCILLCFDACWCIVMMSVGMMCDSGRCIVVYVVIFCYGVLCVVDI